MMKAYKENLGWFYSNDFPEPDNAELALIKEKWSTLKEHSFTIGQYP